jgi:hypothetical protein
MAIAASDIVYRLSGGASNATPLTSLGGVKSSVAASTTIFDDVAAGESSAGDTEYRCVYVHNAHATLTYTAPVAWIATNTPSPGTTIDVGVGTSAVNATEQTVADENTAPTGVTFSAAATQGAGVALGDIPPGQSRAIWVRRTVTAGAAAYADSFTVRVTGTTAP